ncbi:MAG: hypothetical protein FJ125_18165 [Deltaproteobacteria bacterium]|nr:hypothetical protein [Deltaproteobacteria bacterium]
MAGECRAGEPVVCLPYDNECVEARCAPHSGECQPIPVEGLCDDGDLCNGRERCVEGMCRPGEAVVCPPDDNVCTREECNPATGRCRSVPQEGRCDDDDPCNGSERCVQGVCRPGEPVRCARDDNVCTREECDPATGHCRSIPQEGRCDDDDLCNGRERCQGGSCQAGEPVVCGPEESCRQGVCVARCTTACDCPQGRSCVEGVCAVEAGDLYCCEAAGCPLAGACQLRDGRIGLCPGTIDFDRDLQGRRLNVGVDVEELYLPAGVRLSTRRERATVTTNSFRLASSSQGNSCATRDDANPHRPWLGDVIAQFLVPQNGQMVQGAVRRVSLYIGETWSGGIAVELYSPQGERLLTQLTDSRGTDHLQLELDRPIGSVRVRQADDPDFTIDDLSFGPITLP